MALLCTLNNNGQAVTLSNQLRDKARSMALAQETDRQGKREYTFAQTFPTVRTPCDLLLARRQRHPPVQHVKSIVVPPPQMVANMRVGNMDGFASASPGQRAIYDRSALPPSPRRTSGRTIPRKCWDERQFVQKNPNTSPQ